MTEHSRHCMQSLWGSSGYHCDCHVADIKRLEKELAESERQTRAQLQRIAKRDARIARLEKVRAAAQDYCFMAAGNGRGSDVQLASNKLLNALKEAS